MLARGRPDSERYDVAIVGAGAAGLTLAAELAGSGLKTLLLEAGGSRETPRAKEAYRGELADPRVHPWPGAFRVRALGGSSRIWGGRCTPLDEADFAERPWVAGPGWPIPLTELNEFYPRAQAAAEAGAFDYDPASALPGRPVELLAGLDGPWLQTRLERFSKPTNFWIRYGETIRRSAAVRLVQDAPVTAIRLGADGVSVDHLEAVIDGRRTPIRARRYVLAMGGLETTRLLLASDEVRSGGIGAEHGHLGRYYMSHITGAAGAIRLAPGAPEPAYDYDRDGEGVYVRRRLWLTPRAQAELRSLNIVFRTHYLDAGDPAHGEPVLSAMFLVKDLLLFEYARRLRERQVTLGERLRHLGNVARHPLALAAFGFDWARRRTFAERKLPSIVLRSRNGAWPIEFHAEQAPNPDSRVTLSDNRDALGMRRLRIDWRHTAQDVESVQAAYGLLARELDRSGLGALDYDPEEVARVIRREGSYGGHHIGLARMSADPRDGVVDTDLRLHSTPNLYVASTAVFPTSSQANPTLTLLALTLRLADHLKVELSAGGGDELG